MTEQENTFPAEEQDRSEEEITEAEKVNKKIKRREKGVKQYQFFIFRVLLLIVIVWLLFFVFIGLIRMPSGDMYPRVDAGDMVMFYRMDKDPRAQDIIVYQKADSDGTVNTMISRVVAVAGDTVEYTDGGILIVNGNAISETGIFYRGTQYIGETAPEYPLTLGEGECFVLGDRRDQAYDSRAFGPVSTDEILGTVITIMRRNNL